MISSFPCDLTPSHNHLICKLLFHLIFFLLVFPTCADNTHCTRHTHTETQRYTHTVQPLFLLWSDCGRVLCWSKSQTTVAALFVPSLLCDRYEGSTLFDQKPFLSSLSRSKPVWAGAPTWEQAGIREKKLPFLCPHLLFNVLWLSDNKVVLLWCLFCVLLFFLSITNIVFFFFQIDKGVEKKKKRQMIISLGKSFLIDLHTE